MRKERLFLFLLFIFTNVGLFYWYHGDDVQVVHVEPVKMYQHSSNEFYGTFLISAHARKKYLSGDKHKYKYYGDNCLLNGNVHGRLYIAWGSEEDMRIDLGQFELMKTLYEKMGLKKQRVLRNQKPLFKTMLVKCTFPFTVSNAQTIKLMALPDAFLYDREYSRREPMLPEYDISAEIVVPSDSKFRIVNCGRQLFGKVNGDILVRHVENGLNAGIEHFAFYDMGNAKIEYTDALLNHIESETVSIINASSAFDKVHGKGYGRLAAVDSKASAQWYTRYDCINRFYNADWIGFMDFDEFFTEPLVLDKNYPVVHITGKHGDPREYCGLKNVSKKYLNQYSGISPSKYFIQPRGVNLLHMRIHAYPNLKKYPVGSKFLHHRCVNSVIATKQIH